MGDEYEPIPRVKQLTLQNTNLQSKNFSAVSLPQEILTRQNTISPSIKSSTIYSPVKQDNCFCCDAKSVVIASNGILLIYSLIYTIWYGVTKQYINTGIFGVFLLLAFITYLNIFLIQAIVFHVIIATTMVIASIGHSIYASFIFYYQKKNQQCTFKEIPTFETFMICSFIVTGLNLLYRTDSEKATLSLVNKKPPKKNKKHNEKFSRKQSRV